MLRTKTSVFLFYMVCLYHSGVAQHIPVEGAIFGRPFQTNVDHELAKTMLVNPADSSVLRLFSDYETCEPDTETLAKITRKYSLDVATLFFVKRLYERQENRQIQDFYLAATDTLSLKGNGDDDLSFLQDYFIVFVPGFRYRQVDNGGNFLRQRLLFDSAGVPYEMIDIDEVGRVDANAEIIANRLQELSKHHRNIILISVSKGGLETAVALEKLADTGKGSSVKAWINVAGTLRGTPVADRWAQPFMRFWISGGLFWKGIKVDLKGLLTDLSYEQGMERYAALHIPPEIFTVNLIGASLGKVQKKTVFTSPNDRFTPLPDAITDNGAVVVELDLDHFFRDVDLNIRMVALLHYIVATFATKP